jgi:hypothetical protein
MQLLRLAMVLALATCALGSASAPAGAAPTPSPSPAAVPTTGPIKHEPEDPAVSKVARAQFLAWQLGKVDRSRYTDVLSQLISAEKIANSSQGLSRLGPLEKLEYVGRATVDGLPPDNKSYVYHMVCGGGAVYMLFSLTPTGKISSMLFRNALDQ